MQNLIAKILAETNSEPRTLAQARMTLDGIRAAAQAAAPTAAAATLITSARTTTAGGLPGDPDLRTRDQHYAALENMSPGQRSLYFAKYLAPKRAEQKFPPQ